MDDQAWRDELAHRLESYRGRKRKPALDGAQTRLPFDGGGATLAFPAPTTKQAVATHAGSARAVATSGAAAAVRMALAPTLAPTVADEPLAPEKHAPAKEEFSFTIAIGRPPRKREDDTRMVIDVSLPPEGIAIGVDNAHTAPGDSVGLHPVAPMEERRMAAVIDAGCLLFVYGAFLALFSALGVEFTVSKLSGAVSLAIFALGYLQYFALFTVFGGTTPGMMLRGLQVVSFSGEPPTPRQMLWRSVGYLLSAGTFFLGFVWSTWDEDELTWHDRISKTYLHTAESFSEAEAANTAPSH